MSESYTRSRKQKRSGGKLPSEARFGLSFRFPRFRLLRFLRWAMFSLPALAMLLRLETWIVHSEEHFRAANLRLRQAWPAYLNQNQWPEAKIIGQRLLAFDQLGLEDSVSFFDVLIGSGQTKEAFGFFTSNERTRPQSEQPLYKFRFSEKMIATAPSNPQILSEAFVKIRQALASGLPEREDARARRLLASDAYVQGEYAWAMELLKPLEAEDFDVAVEIAWIRWIQDIDGDASIARSEATKTLDKLIRQMEQRKKFRLLDPTTKELNNLAMLLVILGQEKTFFDATKDLVKLSPDDKARWASVISQYLLNSELKKKNPNFEIVSSILLDKLESEPENRALTNQAISVWASQPINSETPLSRWIVEHIESGQADISFLLYAGDVCRTHGKWDDAKNIYARILEKSPDDVVSLNNLAELLYKTPPFAFDKALSLCERALKSQPSNVSILETKGQILARLGRYEESKSILKDCLYYFPDEWNLHNTLAQVYEKTGDAASAEGHRNVLSKLPRPNGAEIYEKLR